jgi:hypothetical protein
LTLALTPSSRFNRRLIRVARPAGHAVDRQRGVLRRLLSDGGGRQATS